LGPRPARKPRVKKEKPQPQPQQEQQPVQHAPQQQAYNPPPVIASTKQESPNQLNVATKEMGRSSGSPDIDIIKTPCLITFFAKKFSGKSSTMRYVLHSLIKAGRFDYGFVISPTGIFNGDWDCILNMQKKLISMGQPKNAFLILDDCVGSVNFNSKFSTIYEMPTSNTTEF